MGDPTYQGEQLLMWFPWGVRQLLEPVGMFHEGYDALGPGFPYLSASDRHDIARRRPAEILLMGIKDVGFESALGALGRYEPVLVASSGAAAGQRRAVRPARPAEKLRVALRLAGNDQVGRLSRGKGTVRSWFTAEPALPGIGRSVGTRGYPSCGLGCRGILVMPRVGGDC